MRNSSNGALSFVLIVSCPGCCELKNLAWTVAPANTVWIVAFFPMTCRRSGMAGSRTGRVQVLNKLTMRHASQKTVPSVIPDTPEKPIPVTGTLGTASAA